MGSFLLSAAQASKAANDWFGLISSLAGLAFDETDRVIEGRRLEQFQFLTSGEGRPIPRVWGRMRVGGHVIFVDAVRENMTAQDIGGKGGGGTTRRDYRYTMSFAVGLCQGPIRQIGRVWADGEELDLTLVSFRLHTGSETQLPDPLLEECLGQDRASGFRGLAYIVFEDFDLTQFGNRLPQLSFEVFALGDGLADMISAVNIIPGATEFGYDPIPHIRLLGRAQAASENIHISPHKSDWAVAMDQLQQSCPNTRWVALVVAWFADDLRLQNVMIAPRCETRNKDTYPSDWSVLGRSRLSIPPVSELDGRPAYGGTPSDASVVRAVQDLHARGFQVLFYPFIMLDVPIAMSRPDPHTDAQQARFPWRGEITCHPAPGRTGTPDGSTAIDTMMTRLFAADGAGLATMVKHYATLCADAGGVEAFLLASELRGISRLRNASGQFPFAEKLADLAAEVRHILPGAKLSYAADWTEYGLLGGDPTHEDFPLDRFWADANCDFVGIDCYFPLSDWRYGDLHIDARDGASSIYDPVYLTSQIRGGEQFDYYYADKSARDAQRRSSLNSTGPNAGLHRMKDIYAWWSQPHYRIINGTFFGLTAWQPQSKPIWFTELGCPAVDKGSNQPNLFPDLQRGEAGRPYYSTGVRDDLIQRQYFRALLTYYRDPSHNPISPVYGGFMIPSDAFFVWSWDARPYPAFPYARGVWADAPNWRAGHWVNARLSSTSLTDMLSDLTAHDLQLDGTVLNASFDGYIIDRVQTRRASLQPLLHVFGLDLVGRLNSLHVTPRLAGRIVNITTDDLAVVGDDPSQFFSLSDQQKLPHEVRLSYHRNDGAYEPTIATARKPGAMAPVQSLALPAVLSASQAQELADRILRESWIERERLSLTLSLGHSWLEPTDIICYQSRLWRVTAVEHSTFIRLQAVAHNQNLYEPPDLSKIAPIEIDGYRTPKIYHPYAVMLDLPAGLPARPINAAWPAGVPVMAATGSPFPESVRVTDEAETWWLDVAYPAVIGRLLDPLPEGPIGRWVTGQPIRIKLDYGALQSRHRLDVLNGENSLAIKTDRGWEILQFTTAELVGAEIYAVGDFLRGQAGSDGVMDRLCPAGRDCVLISNALKPLPIELGGFGDQLAYRYGPIDMDNNSFAWQSAASDVTGAGFKCLAPVHFRAALAMTSDIELSWIRRGRIDADDFEAAEIVLGEVEELYRLCIWADDDLLRQETMADPQWVYRRAEWKDDRAAYPDALAWRVEVAQVSQKRGVGYAAILNISPFLDIAA